MINCLKATEAGVAYDGETMYVVFRCNHVVSEHKCHTFTVAVREDTPFDAFCAVLEAHTGATRILVQQCLFGAETTLSLIGKDRITPDGMKKWQPT